MTIRTLGVAGAGTMGAGIAQLACLAGYETRLWDPDPDALAAATARVSRDLGRGVERARWSATDAADASARLTAAAALGDLGACELVIEAAPEELELKRRLFARLESACGPEVVLATNTSSLAVSAIAAPTARPDRICGMHFFNPPALMSLVEVVAADRTGPVALEQVSEVARRMNRTPIHCKDTPGFIANRCNRPFTLEALRVLEQGVAGHAEIDRVMREDGGYAMGPFELMDLIGIDVNLEVARSLHRQRSEPRWQPHPIQERMVAEGRLGRKVGRGFYDYRVGIGQGPAAEPPSSAPLRRRVLERIVSQLVNEACFAVEEGIAEREQIDTAMRLGLNHPRGPFQWLEQFGAQRVEATLDALGGQTDRRYQPAPLLRRLAAAGQSN